MINCYFDDTGYYISGPNIEIVEEVTTQFTGLTRLYLILAKVLRELSVYNLNYTTVKIHNDSRIIDDMMGKTPIDEDCIQLRSILFQLIPKIDANIVYLKSSVNEIIQKAQQKLLISIPRINIKGKKSVMVDKFKEDWKNGQHNN